MPAWRAFRSPLHEGAMGTATHEATGKEAAVLGEIVLTTRAMVTTGGAGAVSAVARTWRPSPPS